MSKIGEKAISIPAGVSLNLNENILICQGPLGKLQRSIPSGITLGISDNQIIVKRENNNKKIKALHGLFRTLISNMVGGVSSGFQKRLEILGTGYKSLVSGKKITLHLGFSHPREVIIPEDIDVTIEGNNLIISSIDKEHLGDFAAKIREIRKVEPYKGKGIRYKGEKIKKKAGKSGKVAAK